MPLVSNGEMLEDGYRCLTDDAPLPDDGAVLVSADRLFAEADALARRRGTTGVLWPNDRSVSELAPHLHRIALVALIFPSFKDGRAYSQARILRERYGFRGELRATGQILRDQFLFMLRSGFDTLEIAKEVDVPAFAGAVRRYSVFYQPAADGRLPAFRRRVATAGPEGSKEEIFMSKSQWIASAAVRVLQCLAVIAIVFGASNLAVSAASLDEIKARGYMVAATEDDYPPFEYVVNGKPMGYDHALLAVLRKTAGFEIRQEILPWQGILPGVASGKYDAAVTAAVITDERAKSLDFTIPISESTMAYVKRKGDNRINGVKDLSGMTLGVQQGGASFQVLPDLEAELKLTGGKLGPVVQYGAFSEAYQDLVNNRLDAVIQNIVSLSTLIHEKPQQFELGQRVGKKSYAAWAVQKGNKSITDFLDAFLLQEKRTGTLHKLQEQHLRIVFDNLPDEPLLPGDRKIN